MNEEWRDVVGYEGLYQVSNLGRVKSLPEIGYYKTRFSRKGGLLKLTPRSLKRERHSYLCVALHKQGQKVVSVHRLVAFAFLPKPQNKNLVNHKNGIKHDNCVNNLEWTEYIGYYFCNILCQAKYRGKMLGLYKKRQGG